MSTSKLGNGRHKSSLYKVYPLLASLFLIVLPYLIF